MAGKVGLLQEVSLIPRTSQRQSLDTEKDYEPHHTRRSFSMRGRAGRMSP
jgi:hypothetical protein